MRFLSILTNSSFLLLAQQLVSLWFLYDFFLARDSLTASALWKSKHNNDHQFDRIQLLAKEVNNKHCPNGVLAKPAFDKVIFIIIDALGSEFIPTIKNNNKDSISDAMPFLEESIRQKRAMGFVAKAATPTVTMPRIKALLSGTIPSFVDLLYNLASDVSKFDDDNILRIAKVRNKSLVFYGDDTWLSLFEKDIFTRFKETFSFFASDYTSVDTNVTELALPETKLDQIDWDFLILHYLGLDHIGHVFGSNKTPLIREKLLEMDSVIKNIYSNMAMKDHKTLIVICGDHGMSEEGNHGGDSDLEANTAMLFLPINRIFRDVDLSTNKVPLYQIDLAVTLSLLTGMPIPKMSKGVAIERLLGSIWSEEKFILPCAALENMIELVYLMDPLDFESSPEKLELMKLLNSHHKLGDGFTNISHSYFELSRKIQDKLLKTIASRSNPVFLVMAVILVTILSLIRMRKESIRLLMPILSRNERFVCLLTLATPIMMHGSTDFIESEHIFWPIYSLSIIILFSAIAINSQHSVLNNMDTLKVMLFIITFFVTVFWNNLKLFRKESAPSDSILYIISLAFLCNSIRQNSDIRKFKKTSAISVGIIVMLSKYFEESPGYGSVTYMIYRAMIQRIAIVVLVIYTAINIASSNGGNRGSSSLICKLASAWLTLSFLLARKYNFFFLTANLIMETGVNSISNSLRLSQIARALLYINFAQSAFYNQGNTNLFSGIDIKPAFFGQTEYNIYFAIPLVAIATYSTQIYWFMKMFQRTQLVGVSSPQQFNDLSASLPDNSVIGVGDFVINRNFLSLSYYMFVCLVLRNHLFIWSVISPKLIYHFVSNNVLLLMTLLISNLYRFHIQKEPRSKMID